MSVISRRLPDALGPRRRGSTLVELLLWLGVSAILIGMAIPSLTTVRATMAVDRAAQGLASAIQVARSQAMATRSTRGVSREGTTAYRTATDVRVPLADHVRFTAGSATEVRFGPLGPPSAAASFELRAEQATRRVIVTAGGLVQVQR